MKLLVFGTSGQVARSLALRIPAGTQATMLSRAEADLTDPDACARAVAEAAPDAVINAAAYTAVDKAEEDWETARLVNADAPGAMARAAAGVGAVFVHISTDYVFDGSGSTPRQPGDTVGPLGVYGATKLEGERAITEAGGVAAVLRTSWVFSSFGNNFVKTMLRLGAERDALNIVGDQIGGPTEAGDIAAACLTIANDLMADPAKAGLYHFSGAPDTSWADFAREIFRKADLSCEVTDIPSSAYPTPAQRPLNSRLDCSATTSTFGIPRPDWRDSLDRVLKDLKA